MQTMTQRSTLVSTAAIATLLASVSHAQTPGAVQLEEVVVTGSLIRQPNLTATSPLATVTAEAIQAQPATNIEEVLLRSPQMFVGQSNRSGFSTGSATLNLRNLGSTRTLVLVDGKRLSPTDYSTSASDISLIPSILIKRVDIVTGGASAIYGSDAMAGVVNFITDNDFTGVRVNATLGTFQHDGEADFMSGALGQYRFNGPDGSSWGGESREISAMAGFNFADDRGHMLFHAGYREQEPIWTADLDYASCSLIEVGASFACSPSGITSSTRFLGVNGTPASYYLDPSTNLLRAYTTADGFNAAPYTTLQRDQQRYVGGLKARYDFNDATEGYVDIMMFRQTARAETSPSGVNGQAFTISCNNGMLTANQLAVLCGGSTANSFRANISRRNVEGESRAYLNTTNSFRAIAGVRGDLTDWLSYDAYGQFSSTWGPAAVTGDFSQNRLNAALNGCLPGTTAPVQLSRCVPYNIFSAGGVTQAAINYVSAIGTEKKSIDQTVVSAIFNANLTKFGIDTPWSDDGLHLALGASYRDDHEASRADDTFTSCELSSFGCRPPTSGSISVKEAFIEGLLPIISDKPMVQDLSIDAAYRYSDYSRIGGSSTYSVQANYTPVGDIRFRGGYARAERAPNLFELFSPQETGTGIVTVDNCAGATPVYTLEQCQRTGVTPAQYGQITPAPGSYLALVGGNPDLEPEVAKTHTFGTVITPRFLPSATFSFDYFQIAIDGRIAFAPAQQALNQCALTGLSFYCSLVHRAPGTGSLWLGTDGYVVATNINSGALKTSGVDVEATYQFALPNQLGGVSLSLNGTYTDQYRFKALPDSTNIYNCVGGYGVTCTTVIPEWRHTATAAWSAPWDLDVIAAWRYTASLKVDGLLGTGNPTFAADSHLPSYSVFDLSAAYTFHDKYQVRAGVNNILDKSPPIVGALAGGAAGASANTFAGLYDIFGRTVFLKLTADF